MSRVVFTFALAWPLPLCLPVIEAQVEITDDEPDALLIEEADE